MCNADKNRIIFLFTMLWKVEKKALIEYNHNMLAAHVIFPLKYLDIFKFEEIMLFMGKDFFIMGNKR